MKKQKNAYNKFAELSKGLSKIDIKKIGNNASASLINEISDSADEISKALSYFRKKKQNEAVTFESALLLAEGLSMLSWLLVVGADSLKLGPEGRALKTLNGDSLVEAIGGMQDQISELAFQLHLSAESINDAIGLEVGTSAFSWPFKEKSRYGGPLSGMSLGDIPEEPLELVDEPQEILESALKIELDRLEELADLLARLFIELANFFLILPALSPCSSDCTPFTWRKSLVNSGARVTASGKLQPFFVIKWEFCATNACMFWWTDDWWKDLGNTTHDVGRPFKPARAKQAKSKAKRMGKRAAKGKSIGDKVKPPLTSPPAPWTGIYWD
jgi:hypothetical protein